jgi:hypothetical protein
MESEDPFHELAGLKELVVYVRMGAWQFKESLLLKAPFYGMCAFNPLSLPTKRESSFFFPSKYPGFSPAQEWAFITKPSFLLFLRFFSDSPDRPQKRLLLRVLPEDLFQEVEELLHFPSGGIDFLQGIPHPEIGGVAAKRLSEAA